MGSAGVTGLTCALFLADQDVQVTIVAAHMPGDQEGVEYSSPWAGAHWLTAATAVTGIPTTCNWDLQTYEWWTKLWERESKGPSTPSPSGIKMQDSYCYYDTSPGPQDLWWAPYVQSFKQLSPFNEPVSTLNANRPSDVPNVGTAMHFRAPSLNVPRYLFWLQDLARQRGVQLIKMRLPVERGLPGAMATADEMTVLHGRRKADVFVNATGLAARKLCGDATVFPIRGQTVLVRGEATATRTRIASDGNRVYCIPRPGSGTSILGGTRDKGEWDTTPDANITRRILALNALHAPELLTGPEGGFEVMSVQCGLRPGREHGPRVEQEVVGTKKVVHAYGHGGSGYQHSVGSAREVVRLVRASLQVGPRL